MGGCGGCMRAHYCSRECQVKAWPTHRNECAGRCSGASSVWLDPHGWNTPNVRSRRGVAETPGTDILLPPGRRTQCPREESGGRDGGNNGVTAPPRDGTPTIARRDPGHCECIYRVYGYMVSAGALGIASCGYMVSGGIHGMSVSAVHLSGGCESGMCCRVVFCLPACVNRVSRDRSGWRRRRDIERRGRNLRQRHQRNASSYRARAHSTRRRKAPPRHMEAPLCAYRWKYARSRRLHSTTAAWGCSS